MSDGVQRVFLDTDVFLRNNFNYTSPRFESLRALGAAGTIRVFLTDLTVREIEANLKSLVELAAASVKPNAVLKNSTLPHVEAHFEKVDVAAVQRELLAQLHKFLKTAKSTILKVDPAVLPNVLDAYFSRAAPFGTGKNKAEFPDALVIETLRRWCDDEGLDLAVVSSDQGIKSACEEDDTLQSFDDLPAYLDALFTSEEALSGFVRTAIGALHDAILTEAKKTFPERGASLINQDGEVGELELLSIDHWDGDDELELIHLAPGSAAVELQVSMTFYAALNFKDPASGTWDSEDKVMMFQDEVEETVIQEDLEGTIGVEIEFRDLDPASVKLRRVWFEAPSDIDVYSEHDKNW